MACVAPAWCSGKLGLNVKLFSGEETWWPHG